MSNQEENDKVNEPQVSYGPEKTKLTLFKFFTEQEEMAFKKHKVESMLEDDYMVSYNNDRKL